MARTRLAPSLAALRAAKTNGTRLLENCDHRSARMRRFRDLIGMHVSDLGGEDACSSAEQRWSRFLRQVVKVDPMTRRMIHHEDAQTVHGRVQGEGRA
jgi:hypothetical protein